MNTGRDTDDWIQAMQHFLRVVKNALEGRHLSHQEAVYYQSNPAEWHRRMFDILMTTFSESKRLQKDALGIMLAKATKMPASALSNALKAGKSVNSDLEKAAELWDVDRDLAYEQFGVHFEFPDPKENTPTC
jgi:hypothetical protein